MATLIIHHAVEVLLCFCSYYPDTPFLCSIFEGDDNIGKKQKPSSYEHFRNRISNIMANKSNITPHAVSTAMDARLETGVQLAAELRLKVRSMGESAAKVELWYYQ